MKTDEIRYEGTERLVPLSDLKDYKIAKDSTDILGWRVVGADGETLGVVKDLIVDPQAMRVRYVSAVADRKFFNSGDDHYLLIPIGAAALDKKGKNVFVSFIDSDSISRFPMYTGGTITEDYEYEVRETMLRSHQDAVPDTATQRRSDFEETLQQPTTTRRISDDFYNHENYNENRFYSSSWQDDRRNDTRYTRDMDDTRDTNYSRDADDTDSTNRLSTDIYDEDGNPKTVEDSIATIERLEQLRKRGSITDEEFTVLKKRALDI